MASRRALYTGKRPLFLVALGAVYLIGALMSAENLVLNWRAGGGVAWLFVVTAALYAIISYLAFTRSRFALYVALILLAGNIGLWGWRMYATMSLLWGGILIVIINAAIAWYLWRLSPTLRDTQGGRIAFGGAALFLCWMLYLALGSL